MSIARYIGVPYKSRGDQFDGADCWGLARLFNRHELHKDLPDYKSLYVSADDLKDAEQAFGDAAQPQAKGRENWVEVDEPELGDVLLFKQMGVVSHCGIWIDGIDFLHIRMGHQATLDRIDDITWANRLHGIMRWN